jgi:DNA-binding winged helix-turn-helix (wHTH) protein
MAYRNAANLRRMDRDSQGLEQGQSQKIAHLKNVVSQVSDVDVPEPPSPDNELYVQASSVRERLEDDEYQLAFLLPQQGNVVQGLEMRPAFESQPENLRPFSWKELIAKVSESLRDFSASSELAVERFADVRVQFSKMEVTRDGEPVRLTTQEFKTLKFLMQNAERVISRDELLTEAWGYRNYPSTRTVDNHILRLRQKLERDPSRPVHFLTVQRAGYKFVPSGDTRESMCSEDRKKSQ